MGKVMDCRNKMVEYATWATRTHWGIHYAEVRPIPVHIPVKHRPFTTDCSGFITILAKWAGVPDPNGRGYSGEGFTGTLLAHLPHIPFDRTWRGDLVVFGAGTGQHVVMLMTGGVHGGDPWVASHGQES